MNKSLLLAILAQVPEDTEFCIDVDGYFEPVGQVHYNSQYGYIAFAPELDDNDTPPDDEDDTGDDGPTCDVTGVVETIQDDTGTYKVRDA